MSRVDEIKKELFSVALHTRQFNADPPRFMIEGDVDQFVQALADSEEARLKGFRVKMKERLEALRKPRVAYANPDTADLDLLQVQDHDISIHNNAIDEMRKAISAEEGRDERED